MAKDNAAKGPLRAARLGGGALRDDPFGGDPFGGPYEDEPFADEVPGAEDEEDRANRPRFGMGAFASEDELAAEMPAKARQPNDNDDLGDERDAGAPYGDEIVALLHQVGQRLIRSEQDRKELKRAMDDLAQKADGSERAFLTIQDRLSKTESAIEKRQKKLEKIQSEQFERIERAAAMADKIEEALAQQARIDRRLDKLAQDKARTIRKLERIESAVMETHEAINARALPPPPAAAKPAAREEDRDEAFKKWLPQAPAANDGTAADRDHPWWKQHGPVRAAAITGMVLVGLLGGWAVTNINAGGGLDRFAPVSSITGTQTAATPQQTAQAVAPSFDELADYSGQAPGEQEKQEFTQAIAQALNDTYGTPAPQPDLTADAGTPAQAASEPAAVADPAPAKDPVTMSDSELLASFEEDPDALAAQLNEISPSTAASMIDEIHDEAPKQAAKATPAAVKPAAKIKEVTTADFLNGQKDARPLSARIKPDDSLPPVIREVERKAFEGVAEAQHDLAAIYTAGHGGVKIDYPRSAVWFRESALNGIANARYNLGVLYHQGLGVKEDINLAVQWYRAAAEMGHPEAQYNLGIAYIEGIGTTYNPDKAAHYFEKAAGQGIMEAAYNLGLIHENALTGAAQPDEALYWYKQAADRGSPEAKVAMDQLAKTLGLMPNEVERMYSDVKKDKKAAAPASAASAARDIAQAQDTGQDASQGATDDTAREMAATEPAAGTASGTGVEYIEALPLDDASVDAPATPAARQPVKAAPELADIRENNKGAVAKRTAAPDADPAVIAQIQEQLIRLGLYPGPADGVNDMLTQDAIRSYQAGNSLSADGRASQALLVHMMTSDLDTGSEYGSRAE